jgi:uncharacterized protein YkwD
MPQGAQTTQILPENAVLHARALLVRRAALAQIATMPPDLPQAEVAIIQMTNAIRRSSALQELEPNAALTAAARTFADYLAKTSRFAHEADGRKPEDRAEAHGYRYCLVAENLARAADSRGLETRVLARNVVEGWKNSPSHRANLLLKSATEIGVAIVAVPAGLPTYVAVQLLGRPESLKVTFSIENRSSEAVSYRLGTDIEALQPREVATHDDCESRRLDFDEAGRAPTSFHPRDKDRFVIRADPVRGIRIEVDSR